MATDKIIKEPIHIRQKKLANGNLSLYLDIYINGMRSYEFLRLYIIPERNREDKDRNRQTMQLANSIKSKRIMDIQNGEFGFRSLYKLDTLFFEYFRAMCNRRIGSESRGNWGNWISCLHHLMKYAGKVARDIRYMPLSNTWQFFMSAVPFFIISRRSSGLNIEPLSDTAKT